MALVQVDQADLDNFASQVSAAVADISSATTTIAGYIQQLLANQQTPLPAADETNLTNAVAALQGAQSALDALEPPAPSGPTGGGGATGAQGATGATG